MSNNYCGRSFFAIEIHFFTVCKCTTPV